MLRIGCFPPLEDGQKIPEGAYEATLTFSKNSLNKLNLPICKLGSRLLISSKPLWRKINKNLDKESLIPLIEQFFLMKKHLLRNQNERCFEPSEMIHLQRMMISIIGNQCKTNPDIKDDILESVRDNDTCSPGQFVSSHVKVMICKGSKSPSMRVAIVGAMVDCRKQAYRITRNSNHMEVYVDSKEMWHLVLEKMTGAKQKIEPTNEWDVEDKLRLLRSVKESVITSKEICAKIKEEVEMITERMDQSIPTENDICFTSYLADVNDATLQYLEKCDELAKDLFGDRFDNADFNILVDETVIAVKCKHFHSVYSGEYDDERWIEGSDQSLRRMTKQLMTKSMNKWRFNKK